MIDCSVKPIGFSSRLLSALCLVVLLSACADKAAVRQAESERYRQLETDMINAQQDEVQRRRAELRIAQKLQQLDSERSADARQRLQSRQQTTTADNDRSAALTASTPPVVTQIVIAQSDTLSGAEPWKLQSYPGPSDGVPICALVSEPVLVMNGNLETRTRVIIGSRQVFLRSDATFDTDATETGFRVDAGIPIAFDRFINELTAEVDASYDRLLTALDNGVSLAVSFAFKPQLSSAETHVIEFSLQNLESALPALAACDTQESGDTAPDAEEPASS